jgi:rubredoxin
MKKAKFKCKRCGYEFVKEIFEPGEAEEKRIPSSPIDNLRCPKCGGPVERM